MGGVTEKHADKHGGASRKNEKERPFARSPHENFLIYPLDGEIGLQNITNRQTASKSFFRFRAFA